MLEDMRVGYRDGPSDGVKVPDDPLEVLSTWIAEAEEAGSSEPNAMHLATHDEDGPDGRMVLLKHLDSNWGSSRTPVPRRHCNSHPTRPVRSRSGGLSSSDRSAFEVRSDRCPRNRWNGTMRRDRGNPNSQLGRQGKVGRSRRGRPCSIGEPRQSDDSRES